MSQVSRSSSLPNLSSRLAVANSAKVQPASSESSNPIVENEGPKQTSIWFEKFSLENGALYTGQMLNEKPHGIGESRNKKASSYYIGEWENGKQKGHGTYTSAHTTYRGEWEAGKQSGYGVYIYACGSIYIGKWEKGKEQGIGIKMSKPDNTIYLGEWRSGERDGHGVKINSNEDKYKGLWKKNSFNGYVLKEDKNGNVIQSGIWSFNSFIGDVDISDDLPQAIIKNIEAMNKKVPNVMSECEKAEEKAKEAYLKFQDQIHQSYPSQADTFSADVRNVLNKYAIFNFADKQGASYPS